MRNKTLLVLSVSALALAVSSAPARAERGRNPLAGQPAIRHRVEMRKLRFEVSPQLMLSINQPYLIGVGGGANLQFHVTDWLGIGASFHYMGNVASPLEGSVESALYDPTRTGAMKPPDVLKQPTAEQFKGHLVGPNLLGAVYATLTPIGGKFALFNALFANYDFYGLVGFGIANLDTPFPCSGSTETGCPNPVALATGNDVNKQQPAPFTGIRPGGVVGIGTHFFFNHWLGLQLELRDYFYKSNPGGLDVKTTDQASAVGANGQKLTLTDRSPVLTGDDEYMVNTLYFGIGLTFMLPPTAKISR